MEKMAEKMAAEDAAFEAAEARAEEVWVGGSNDDVWEAVFAEGSLVAGELLPKIESDPEFRVGDLTHAQCVEAIVRRYPLIGGGR